MNHYSAKQFHQNDAPNLRVDEGFLEKAEKDEFCFVEGQDILPYKDKIQGIILCRWNRTYPADAYLKIPGSVTDWEIHDLVEFKGKSHENISVTYWRKRV